MEAYKIIRFFEHGRSRTIKRGLSLEAAREWCRRPDTSSSTCTPVRAREVSRGRGRWFDGYDHDVGRED